jgi:phosphoribosylformimino-5-aminoimidazole carboxamide ribonucleotide (ProFAR) isomerase
VSIVNRTHQRKFNQRNVDLARALAGPAATALENVRLLEATQRRAEREQRIRHITTRVRAAGNIQGILETTAAELAQAMGVSRAIVRLTAGDAQRCNSTRASDLSVPGNGHSGDEERLS